MINVAVFNVLNVNNHGDQFIADCVKYILTENEDAVVKNLNLEPQMSFPIKQLYLFIQNISKFFRKVIHLQDISDILMFIALWLRNSAYYNRIVKSSDRVIVGGGSFKYGTQRVWADYSLLIRSANKYHVPVMLNALNIQEYNKNSWKCRCLAKYANFPIVRIITTRDGEFGVKRLRQEYKIKPHVLCAAVGDPAFWIPECYRIEKDKNAAKVGINIINGKNFRNYGGTFSEEDVVDMYCQLLEYLDKKNIPWELFINGMRKDYLFGRKVLEKYGNQDIEIVCPSSAIEAVKKISSYKVILGARLHACICAYSLDIPLAGINWDEKLKHFSEIAKIEDLFFSEKTIKNNSLGEKLVYLYENGYSYDKEIRNYWKNQTGSSLCAFVSEMK